MKTSDLRIGNWVWANGDLATIETIAGHSCWVRFYIWKDGRSDTLEIDIENIESIELTEDWLIKFGFELDDQECYSKWEGALNYSYSLEHGFCFGQGIDYSHEIKIEHVHQLQNLYHALTGEELTIKEKVEHG